MKFNDLMPKIDTSFIDEINKQNQEMLNNITPFNEVLANEIKPIIEGNQNVIEGLNNNYTKLNDLYMLKEKELEDSKQEVAKAKKYNTIMLISTLVSVGIALASLVATVLIAILQREVELVEIYFKIQQYQTDAVDAVVKVFNGQGFYDKINYIRDLGKMKSKDMQMTLGFTDEEMQLYDPTNDTGYKNELVELSDEQLLSNIQALQRQNNIKLSNSLVKDLGRCSLDIEMETGTGKTYVYIKTMFELNKKYGWSKFIVVVPSIAFVRV